MTVLTDSNAFRDERRMLPQHQAALTLLQGMLANPKITSLYWLDLACGRGQIISGLDENLSGQARSKLNYFGYDIKGEYAKETLKLATNLGLQSYKVEVGYLANFGKICPEPSNFDFITLTNTVHEVAPSQMASILMQCINKS